jgi:hypothetical protein
VSILITVLGGDGTTCRLKIEKSPGKPEVYDHLCVNPPYQVNSFPFGRKYLGNLREVY